MDDDNPPPRKRSRFFENGRSKIGSILNPSRRSSNRQPAPSNQNASSSHSATGNNSPLVDNPAFTEPRPPLSFRADFNSDRVTAGPSRPLQENPRGSQEPGSRPSNQERSFGDAPSSSAISMAEEHELDEKAKKQQRRKGIYGLDSLRAQSREHDSGEEDDEGDDHQDNDQDDIVGQFPIPGVGPHAFGGIPRQFTFTGTASSTPLPRLTRPTTDQVMAEQHPNTPQRMIPMIAPGTPNVIHGKTGETHATPPPPDLPPPPPPKPYVDMDRDSRGNRIQYPIYHPGIAPHPSQPVYANSSGRPAYRLAQFPDSSPPYDGPTSDTLLTSPRRLQRAQQQARISLKRKRVDPILPPPAYIYTHTDNPSFNVFNGILLYPELVFALASHLPVKDLVSLYAISKDFHTIIDTRFTTVVLNQALTKAPESARIFGFRTYGSLCRTDPAARIPHPDAGKAAQNIPRRIPSFRWLKMVLHREKVVHELVTVFAEDGIPLPFRCRLALKRLWFLLDIPDNARRIGYVHNARLLSNLDIYFAACFFVKLDLRLNDPRANDKRDGLRKMLLQQRSFTTILRVIKREIWQTKYDVLQEWVRQRYIPRGHELGVPIFGVPPEKVGKGKLEYWGERSATVLGRPPKDLLRPDQLIVREALRRGIPLGKEYMRLMLAGYVRPDTLDNYAPRKYGRRIEYLEDEEYEVDDIVGGVAALGVDDEGFDSLLDLGPPRRGSRWIIEKEKIHRNEMELRKEEEELAKMCVEWWKNETTGATSDRMDIEDDF
ncbi:hypothetical protein PV08_08525 [Exophiala spinifera]|uniref:F-box domain-containing protein n=1 Tax=Exophiala spinifera TaxID=91928 RepID=A0A0D1ZKI0_9EURO|nr:uncharacterized protein PV08_08525 [Exophiala spinifera]KIW13337.1 hypothetical protein PV08_08525 [Exophiala spinifera]